MNGSHTFHSLLASLLISGTMSAQTDSTFIHRHYHAAAQKIIRTVTADSSAYRRLEEFCDLFGHRFSGSDNLERAIEWMLSKMNEEQLENVRGQEAMVPRWIRGKEHAALVSPLQRNLPMLGLGGSIGTPAEGITAEALVVDNFDELSARSAEARGRIVVYNVPFTSYGETVQYRSIGAISAARHGAIASLIRSVGTYSMQTPHTGAMRYDDQVPRIPHAAITSEDAAMLRRMQDRGERPVLHLFMEAQTLPDVPSRNVIAEIPGSQYPEEVVVFGGHIDSWDVGQGAHDNAGNCLAAWHALRTLRRLGFRAKRTIRVVLWTNEENGLRGSHAYADQPKEQIDNHVVAIEADAGVFAPLGFGFTGSDSAFAVVSAVGRLLASIGAESVTRGGGGADISTLMRKGVPGMGLRVRGDRYFWFHHTDADTVDKIDPRDLNLSAAALAVMAYVLADLPDRLPR